MPTARPTQTTKSGRPPCCNNVVCHKCPIDSKYTIRRDDAHLYSDPRVKLVTEATVTHVITSGNVVTGVQYAHKGKDITAKGDFVGLGANAIFNPHILLRSGIKHPMLGKRLHEQCAKLVFVDLDGLNNFQGSTAITGHGYMIYDGPHRSQRSGALMEHWNHPLIRLDKGKWRQRMQLKFIYEDLPDEKSSVAVKPGHPNKPLINHNGLSQYCQRGIDHLEKDLETILSSLPVERVQIKKRTERTEAHILGTALMGNDKKSSVVDAHQIHHQYRNLAVLGGSSFPTGAPANPTLTICALSLWSARNVFGANKCG